MKITIIGTSSGQATPSRNQAALLLEINDHVCLLDAGEGTTRAMLADSMDPNAVTSIIITHTHVDHCGGLAGLIQYMHLTGRTEPLSVYLPKETVEGIQTYLHAVYLINEKLSFSYTLHGWDSGIILEGDDCKVSVHLTHHLDTINAISFRILELRCDGYCFVKVIQSNFVLTFIIIFHPEIVHYNWVLIFFYVNIGYTSSSKFYLFLSKSNTLFSKFYSTLPKR